MFIESMAPELINLSVCIRVGLKEGQENEMDSGIYAQYIKDQIPILTRRMLYEIATETEGEDPFGNTNMNDVFEEIVYVINSLIAEPFRMVITHYDILHRVARRFPEIGKCLKDGHVRP
jgi:hypothetical protein